MKLCKDCKHFTPWYADNPAYNDFTCSFVTPTKREVPIDPVHGKRLYDSPRTCAVLRMPVEEYDERMTHIAYYYDLCGYAGKHYEPREPHTPQEEQR